MVLWHLERATIFPRKGRGAIVFGPGRKIWGSVSRSAYMRVFLVCFILNNINNIESSTINKTIHIPINSSITTKCGSFNSTPLSSNLKLVDKNPKIKIIIKIDNRAKSPKFPPKNRIIKQGNKLQNVPDPILI